MPPDLFHEQWRFWLVVSRLEALAQTAQSGLLPVEVQVVARRLWEGLLPATTSMQAFTDIWNQASATCGLPPGHRDSRAPMRRTETLLGDSRHPQNLCDRRTRPPDTLHPEIAAAVQE